MSRGFSAGAMLAIGVALCFASPAAAEPAAGVSAAGDLLWLFDTSSPGLMTGHPISGLNPQEKIAAIDVRPATGQLYGLGIENTAGADSGRIYTLDPATGAATEVGSTPFATTLTDASSYGFDFNPVSDRIRVVNRNDQNMRVNPNNGVLAGTDTTLDNTGTEDVVGSAYDRNFAGAPATTLFGIDFNNVLVRQGGVDGNPTANLGQLTTIGATGIVTTSPDQGFDISAGGTAYFTAQAGGPAWRLYTINLATGGATLLGTLATPLGGFAVLPTPQPPAPPASPGATPTTTPTVVSRKKCKKRKRSAAESKRKCKKRR